MHKEGVIFLNLSTDELLKEQSYLTETLDVINKQIKESNVNISQEMAEMTDFKRFVWGSKGEMDAAEMAMKLEYADIDIQLANIQIMRTIKLMKALKKPYFGRIDFKTDDDSYYKVYVGLANVEEKFKFHVYDWRTPIASLFYNYELGKALYEAPEGIIKGVINLKRQYKIEQGELKYCFDNEINIGDEYLQEILSEASTDKMKNIVNTIQKEQNEIIRNVKDKILIVQGSAGSGKTSVALHRIAYLLYAEKNLKHNNVLIFSPNDVFSEYISNVLPELGEKNVLQTTFSDFAYSYIPSVKKIESFTDFLERNYGKESKYTDLSIIKIKLSDEFKLLLDEYINKTKTEMHFTDQLIIGHDDVNELGFGEFKYSKDEMNYLLQDKYKKLPLKERLDHIATYICDNIGISFRRYNPRVKKKLKEILNRDFNAKVLYKELFESELFYNRFKFNTKMVFKANLLNYEDLLPLLYIDMELNGYPPNTTIKHIIIDEGQDYSSLQYDIMSKIFTKASFTILGDVNQTINPHYIYSNLRNLGDLFKREYRYLELTKTYRSSEEIINYTNKILGINNICSVRKTNNYKVIQKNNLTIVDDINEMKNNGMKRIAVITKTHEETEFIYKLVKGKFERVSLIDKSNKKVHSDLIIIPSYIAKGLEFDGVIVYNHADNPYTKNEKHLYYVACTRAQHSLIVYNQATI
jgi:DNA helicase II / ATP-dependent DNA helicase PcrA